MTKPRSPSGVGSNQYVTRPGGSTEPDRSSLGPLIGALTEEDHLEQIGRAFRSEPVSHQEISAEDCPGWLLDYAATESDRFHQWIANHPNCPPETLRRLASSTSLQTAYVASRNPNLPADCRRLAEWTVTAQGLQVVLSTDDPWVAASVAFALDATLHHCVGDRLAGGARRVWLAEPAPMTDLEGNPVGIAPAGAYTIDDIDPGEAVAFTLPDGTHGWVDGDRLGEWCDQCNGHGEIVLNSNPDDYETDECENCGGIGRVAPPSARTAPIPPDGDPAWWVTT